MAVPNPLPLVVQNLSFRYRDQEIEALRNISFQVEAGQVILIAGASGSGKTTLMRCLNGLIPHSYKGGELTGKIRVFGNEPSALTLSKISKMVGTVLQNPEKQIVASYVANEIAFGMENLGVPRPEMRQRIDAILTHLNILHLRDRECFHLSGGERQKVVVAATLVLEPSILLLDEPLANLDPFSLRDTLMLIRRLADEGKTVLIIEHRVEDVLKIRPDKVLFLVDGEQQYFGDLAGFREVADPVEVKLPAQLTIQRLKVLSNVNYSMDGRRSPVKASESNHKTPLLQFKAVDYWYEPDKPVLHDVNFTVNSGDVIAILGPNGAGKTTLVKQAIGLLKPRQGQVLVEGRDNKDSSVAKIARAVGYVFQSPSHMLFAPTVKEELAFGPRNLGFDEATIANNITAALELVDLQDKAGSPPLALSFGQQKRVTIAAVVAMNSRILVMDEPTAGQDYRHYTEFMDAILYPKQGSPWSDAFEAVIFITHDLDLAISYANRVLLVSDGRVAAAGPPHEVLQDRDLLTRCRLMPTSLLELNLELLGKTGRFMRAELLAPYVHAVPMAATGVDDKREPL
jgi:energy-coupling factor transport system ATP-binding protein